MWRHPGFGNGSLPFGSSSLHSAHDRNDTPSHEQMIHRLDRCVKRGGVEEGRTGGIEGVPE